MKHCTECNYQLDGYAEDETLCGACLNQLGVSELSESEALALVAVMSQKFGWKSTIFTPLDIRDSWLNIIGEEITSDELTTVLNSREWCKTLEDVICTEGMLILEEAIELVASKKGK